MMRPAKQMKTLPKVFFGADHGGYGLKQTLIGFVKEMGYETTDLGTHKAERCDYPDVASALCRAVLAHKNAVGVLVCGTGIGMSIAANKVDGIRCALCHDHYTAKMAREHNNANVLAMGERVIGVEVAKDMMKTYLTTEFGGGRHETRVKKIMALQNRGE